MAQPNNGHYAHSDGYRSDRGSPDKERMMVELCDDLEQIDGVSDVIWDTDINGPYADVTYDGDASTRSTIEWTVDGWTSGVVAESDEWLEVRPE